MAFVHGVDKSDIPTINILGVDVAAVDMRWLMHFTKKNISALSGDYICVSNVHTTVMASEDKKYKSIQNGGILAIPDGGPLSTVGRRRGKMGMRRTTGPNYMKNVMRMRGYRHFFYGSTPETIEKMKTAICEGFPNAKVVGLYSPPFRELTKEEDDLIIEQINKASPDFIWVGLGAPKQEEWMAFHQGRVKGLMVGVGAAFDYLAGNIKRAPDWMQKRNMEWLYRLFQDPKRLLKRYIVTNTKFVWRAMIKGE